MNSTTSTAVQESAPKILVLILGIITICITVIGNILVLMTFPLNRQVRSVVSNYFLLSLAVADLIIGVVSMPLFIITIISNSLISPILCDFWLAIDYTSSNSSATHLLIICLDRYLSITRPLSYRVKRTRRKAIFACLIIWIYSICLWCIPIFLQRRLLMEGKPTGLCNILFMKHTVIRVLSMMIVFFVPTLLMFILYSMIYLETRKRKKNLKFLQAHRRPEDERTPLDPFEQLIDIRKIAYIKKARLGFRLSNYSSSNYAERKFNPPSPIMKFDRLDDQFQRMGSSNMSSEQFGSLQHGSKNSRKNRKEIKNEQKAAKTLSAILFTFLMTWAPYSIYTLLFTHPKEFSVIFNLCYALCYLNSTFNPLLYAMCNENFRKTFIYILTFKCKLSQIDTNNGMVVKRQTNRLRYNIVTKKDDNTMDFVN